MKNFSFITALLLCVLCVNSANAIPVYRDEIPQAYINKVKNTKPLNYKQALPVFDIEKSLAVPVYSPQRITLKTQYRKDASGSYVYSQNYDIGDKIKFIVAEDVIKNNKIYIKKGTEAIGIIREAQIGMGVFTAPDEIQVSFFETRDVNNQKVSLYGSVIQEGKHTGLFQIFIMGLPSLRASLPKGKVYTLYCK